MFTFKEIFDLFVNEKRRNSVYKKLVYIIISIFSLWKNKQANKQKNKEIVLRISGILVWMNPRGYNQNLQDPLWFG